MKWATSFLLFLPFSSLFCTFFLLPLLFFDYSSFFFILFLFPFLHTSLFRTCAAVVNFVFTIVCSGLLSSSAASSLSSSSIFVAFFSAFFFVLVAEFVRANPNLHPIKKYADSDEPVAAHGPIDAICVFQEPGDWGEALQIMCDILRTVNGVPGHENENPSPEVPAK